MTWIKYFTTEAGDNTSESGTKFKAILYSKIRIITVTTEVEHDILSIKLYLIDIY